MLFIYIVKKSIGKEVPNSELSNKFKAFSEKHEIKFISVWIRKAMGGSRKGTALYNGGNKRIYFDETLLNICNEKELLAIYAHEIGHRKMK